MAYAGSETPLHLERRFEHPLERSLFSWFSRFTFQMFIPFRSLLSATPYSLGTLVPALPTCQPQGFLVLSELPIKRLTRATRFRGEQARRRAGKAGQLNSYVAVRGKELA